MGKLERLQNACLRIITGCPRSTPVHVLQYRIPSSRSLYPPSNDHRSQLIGSRFFCYNSPAAAAREVFKPSTDVESLLGSIKKKIFWFGWGVRLGEARKVGVFLIFGPTLMGPGRQSHGPKFWLKLFLETRWSPASIEPLLDLLACLELKFWPKNPILPPNSEKSENAWVSHWRLAITSDNSPPEDASELHEPSKDSWTLLVCTEKKTF